MSQDSPGQIGQVRVSQVRRSMMQRVNLNSGYSIPSIGLGVFENAECQDACLKAFECGYRHIDTAQIYKNEREVGEAIEKSGIPRQELFVTTKLKTKYYAKRPNGKKPHNFEKTIKGVEESLKLLKSDYIDLFLIHSAHGGRDSRLKTWEGLEVCRKAGKIKSIGVSNYGIHHLQEIQQVYPDTKISVNQIELSPFCQQKAIVGYCQKNGIAVSAYSPLIRGQRFNHPILIKLSQKNQVTVAQILIRWSIQKGFIVLPKSCKEERIFENFKALDFELSEDDMNLLDELDQGKQGAVTWNPVDID